MTAWRVGAASHADDAATSADVSVLGERLSGLETRVAAAEADLRTATMRATPPKVPVEQLRAIAEDLAGLRDAVRGELRVVDARLNDLRRRIDELAAPGTAPVGGQLTPDEEGRWATFSKSTDAGTRFSALVRLANSNTERSIAVAVERLSVDTDIEVVWQAIRNLGQFKAKDEASHVAPFLEHQDAVLRAAAYEALRRMGAPTDIHFEATESPEKRKPAAEQLRRWADQP